MRVFLLFLFFSFTNVYPACDLTDAANHIIHLDKPAQRVISLAPDLTETIFAIGGGKQLVGVISGSDYPQAASKVPVVGSYTGIDVERIIALHPDLILTWGNVFSRQLNILRPHVQIYTSLPKRLEDIPLTVKNLGCLTGHENMANQIANAFNKQLALLAKQYQTKKKMRAFFQIGTYSLMTINKDSWINQALEFCGGKNVFAGMHTIAGEVSWEAVLTANPEIILSDASNANWKKRWQKWQGISAVQNNLLFTLDPDLIERASPRLVQGVAQICRYLQQAREQQFSAQD